MLEKHAYLILAHKSDYVLNSLLRLIDDERNDIFIHMDKRNRKYNESKTCLVVKKATIKHCERWKCAWGGYALVKAELSLLELATKSGNYSYYHLLSGQAHLRPCHRCHQEGPCCNSQDRKPRAAAR